MVRIKIDDSLEQEISYIQNHFAKHLGMHLSRPQALRMLLKQYKQNNMPLPKRKPRSKKWEF